MFVQYTLTRKGETLPFKPRPIVTGDMAAMMRMADKAKPPYRMRTRLIRAPDHSA